MLIREVVETIDIKKGNDRHHGNRDGNYKNYNNNRQNGYRNDRGDNNDGFKKGTMRGGHHHAQREEEQGSWLKEDNEEKLKLKQRAAEFRQKIKVDKKED